MKSLYRLSLCCLFAYSACTRCRVRRSAVRLVSFRLRCKDEIGAANLLTPEGVLQSVQLVKQGKTLVIGVPVDKDFRRSATKLPLI